MANFITYTYPPEPHGGAPRATEIIVTEDHALEAVRVVVRTIEFLRSVFCGGAGADAFAVPPKYVGGVEDNQPPRRPAPIADPTGSSSFSTGGADNPHSPSNASLHRRSPGLPVVRSSSPAPSVTRRPYDSICVPVSTNPNRSLGDALHQAQGKVAALRYIATLRGGSNKTDVNAAPFVLRVRLCRPGKPGFLGKATPEPLEEWEFHFVKVNYQALTQQHAAAVRQSSGPPLPNASLISDSSATFGPRVAAQQPTPLEHALGLGPFTGSPNDAAKLRDVMHFVNRKSCEAFDTFAVDDLRKEAEIIYEIAVDYNPRSRACHSHSGSGHGSSSPQPEGASSHHRDPAAPSSAPSGVMGTLTSFFRR